MPLAESGDEVADGDAEPWVPDPEVAVEGAGGVIDKEAEAGTDCSPVVDVKVGDMLGDGFPLRWPWGSFLPCEIDALGSLGDGSDCGDADEASPPFDVPPLARPPAVDRLGG